MDGRYSTISQPIHSIVVRDGSTNTYINKNVLKINSGVNNYPAQSYPTGVALELAHTGIDSEGNGPPTYTVGGLYGQKYNKSGFPTTADGNGTVSLPLSSPTFFTSISYSSLGDNYIYVFIGYFKPPTAGTYTFYTSSDDGSAVWIGDPALSGSSTAGQAVVNNNFGGSQGNTKRSGTISLEADTYYPIRIMGTEGGGGDNLTFSWAGPSISETTDLTQYYYYFDTGTNFTSSGGPTIGYVDKSTDNLLSVPNSSSGTNVYTYKKIHTINSVTQPKNTIVDADLSSGGEVATKERWVAWT
jgi:hypothetical protein